MKKKQTLLTALTLLAGGAAITSKEGKKALKKVKKSLKKLTKELTNEKSEKPVYDPLDGLSDEARALVQAVWNLVKDELEDDMTITDVRAFMEETDLITSISSFLVKHEDGTPDLSRHSLIMAAYACIAPQMNDEERMDALLTTIDRMYAERQCQHDCNGFCCHNEDNDCEDDYDDDEEDF